MADTPESRDSDMEFDFDVKTVGNPHDILELPDRDFYQHPVLKQLKESSFPWTSYVKVGIPTLVTPCYVPSVHEMFAQTINMFQTTKKLNTDIQALVGVRSLQKFNTFQLGSACAAPFNGQYFRAEIINTHVVGFENDIVEVFFSDFGNTTSVEKAKIFKLPEPYLDIPRQVIHCQWDLGLTSELSTKHKMTLLDRKDPAKTILPRVEIAPGQFVVSLGNYRPRSKIIVHKADGSIQSY